MDTYQARLAELDRRYKKLQRRTILYGLLALAVSAYLALWVVRMAGAASTVALAVGVVVSFTITQVTVSIVRRLNPL